MAESSRVISRDYVYVPLDAEGMPAEGVIESVRLNISVGDNKLFVEIHSEKIINKIDLENIIHSISNGILKKTRVDINGECEVFLIEQGKRFRVHFIGTGSDIEQLEPVL